MAHVYGWGANVADASDYPNILQEVSVPVVTMAQCANDVTFVDEGMICAGGVLGEDSCFVSYLKYLKSRCRISDFRVPSLKTLF